MMRPLRSSNWVSSISARPRPMMMPPRNWLAPVLALRMRPQSNEPRKRLTRISPVTALTFTSQNMAACECIDQCRNFGDCDIDRVLTFYLNMIEGQLKGSGFGVVIDASPEELARSITNLLMDGIATSRRTPLQSGAPGTPNHS